MVNQMYSKTGWYQIEEGEWTHLKGRCERAEKNTAESGMWRWWAIPNGAARHKCRTLRDAKLWVETHGMDESEARKAQS